MLKKFSTNNANETIEIGLKVGKLLHSSDVVLLTGDLSAGKTTITKGIGQALGVTKVINSPTFTIVKPYQGKDVVLYHLDLYRLNGLNQDFDLEEYIESEGVCVIEWPYQIKEILPDNYLLVNLIRLDENRRDIEITGIGYKYQKIEEAL